MANRTDCGEDMRTSIEPGTVLELFEEDGSSAGRFTIGEYVGRGATAICYEAERDTGSGSRRGRLKEIIPYGENDPYFLFERDARDRQIKPANIQQEHQLDRLTDSISSAYKKLELVRNSSASGSILNNFIPDAYLFTGRRKGKKTTLYIWTPSDRSGVSFEEYLDSLSFGDPYEAAISLNNIIGTVITLTECLGALHSRGLLHLDVKPSNFLVCHDRFNDINPYSISMFDINTVVDVSEGKPFTLSFAGTSGFASPMLASACVAPSEAYDIYSVTATLYYALSANAQGVRSCFRSTGIGYSAPADIEKNWKILASAAEYYDEQFTEILQGIFRKGFSLSLRADAHYAGCDDLMDDLMRLRGRLTITGMHAALAPNERLAIVKDEPYSETESKRAIQDLLCEAPLYTHSHGEALNVLVLGSGSNCCRFVDSCLQVGQMLYSREDGTPAFKSLRISVFSRSATNDMENYIRHRPGLPEFFNINGSLDGCSKEIYGVLDYCDCGSVNGSAEFLNPGMTSAHRTNADLADRILARCPDTHYVFVALGSDSLNRSVAKHISGKLNGKAVVAFAHRSENIQPLAGEETVPVYLPGNAKAQPRQYNAELERMAFNTHLTWTYYSSDLPSIRKEFENPYYRESSIECALSLQYKLHSLGIGTDDLNEAAAQYKKKVLTFEKNDSGEEVRGAWFDYLVALEHRRWVTEKITLRWIAPTDSTGEPDVSYCVNGDNKDKKNRWHTCLVRSEVGKTLAGCGFTDADWDNENFDLDRLDDLDRVSVRIHRCLHKAAEEKEKSSDRFDISVLTSVERIVHTLDRNIIDEYNNLLFCIDNITKNNRQYAFRFEGICDKLLDMVGSAEGIPSADSKQITDAVEKARSGLYLRCASLRNVDYKSKDEDIIRNTPFVLTHSDKRHLALPLSTGNNNSVYRNVASALLLIPEEITYLYYCDSRESAETMATAMQYVSSFLSSRRAAGTVNYLIAHPEWIDQSVPADAVRRKHAGQYDGRDSVTYIPCADQDDAMEKLGQALEALRVDLFEANDTRIGSIGFARGLPRFCFDSGKGRFHSVKGCDYVNHITIAGKHALTVNDMFSLNQAAGKRSPVPEFQKHYSSLWNIYTTYTEAWKLLCDCLAQYVSDHHTIREFTALHDGEKTVTKQFVIADYQKTVMDKIISGLSDADCRVLESGSGTAYCDLSSVMVTVVSTPKNVKTLEVAMELISEIAAPELISIERVGANRVVLMINRLEIYDLVISCGKDWLAEDMVALVNRLCSDRNNQFIRKLVDGSHTDALPLYSISDDESEVTLNFRITTQAVRRLMLQAGRILEVYTYYQLKETGYFDDIISSHEIDWNGTGAKNELDCVLTKGFNTVFVECKAQRRLQQEHYLKLADLADHFGINVTAILVADTGTPSSYEEVNRIQREYGERHGIVTIENRDAINNIGQTLTDLLKEKYR